jgi:hypothetical protein
MPEPQFDRDGAAPGQKAGRSEFVESLQKGLLIGAALLVLIVPPLRMAKNREAQQQAAVATAPAAPQGQAGDTPPGQSRDAAPAVRRADFRDEDPSPQARQVADWAIFTGNNGRHAFVIVDKKDARVYVFSPDGRLKDSAPALLGSARGDDTFPGVGDKPLSAVRPEEKTTPAGRFVAEPGLNSGHEDVVWVDYNAAVSMHRIRPLVARERRLERLASLSTDDNRISFGCINLPVTFYENVLAPTVRKQGAIIYVLPEVKTAQEMFGAFDVNDAQQVAAWRQQQATRLAAAHGDALQKVSLRPASR